MVYKAFTEDRLIRLGRMTIELSKRYMPYRKKEGIMHDILLGAMGATFGPKYVEREYLPPGMGQKRIDYRYGTSNPRVVELVVRDPVHKNQHSGSQNKSELRKLYRVTNAKARTRFLLILDASRDPPFPKPKLKRSFDKVRQEYGRFKRHPITVLYVHPKTHHKFTWPP